MNIIIYSYNKLDASLLDNSSIFYFSNFRFFHIQSNTIFFKVAKAFFNIFFHEQT